MAREKGRVSCIRAFSLFWASTPISRRRCKSALSHILQVQTRSLREVTKDGIGQINRDTAPLSIIPHSVHSTFSIHNWSCFARLHGYECATCHSNQGIIPRISRYVKYLTSLWSPKLWSFVLFSNPESFCRCACHWISNTAKSTYECWVWEMPFKLSLRERKRMR